MKKSCDNCSLRWICIVKQDFEKPLLDTRRSIRKGMYPELCKDFFQLLASNCTLHKEE